MEHRDTPTDRRHRRNQAVVAIGTVVLASGVLASWMIHEPDVRRNARRRAPSPAPPRHIAPLPRPTATPAQTVGSGRAKKPEPNLKPKPEKPRQTDCPRCGSTIQGLGLVKKEWRIGDYRVLALQTDPAGLDTIVIRRNGRTLHKLGEYMGYTIGSTFGGSDCNSKILATERSKPNEPGSCRRVFSARHWVTPGKDLTGDGQPKSN